ncbi:response regulator [Clostridium sp.]|uniref:response regulator n=1 Tax=Clostridium sp. TaxID=1506 RepID=UPI001B523E80|nr:response regulator [Clostridium sp.]MBP3917195.1 response regulator [Clostridium sp.]
MGNRNRSVLIVDDTKFTRNKLSQILKNKPGYAFLNIDYKEACNGKEALDLLKDENFDLMLLDINMPVIDGYEVLKRMKSEGSNCQVIVITGDQEVTTDKLKEFDVKMLLYKPFDSKNLWDVIIELNEEFIWQDTEEVTHFEEKPSQPVLNDSKKKNISNQKENKKDKKIKSDSEIKSDTERKKSDDKNVVRINDFDKIRRNLKEINSSSGRNKVKNEEDEPLKKENHIKQNEDKQHQNVNKGKEIAPENNKTLTEEKKEVKNKTLKNVEVVEEVTKKDDVKVLDEVTQKEDVKVLDECEDNKPVEGLEDEVEFEIEGSDSEGELESQVEFEPEEEPVDNLEDEVEFEIEGSDENDNDSEVEFELDDFADDREAILEKLSESDDKEGSKDKKLDESVFDIDFDDLNDGPKQNKTDEVINSLAEDISKKFIEDVVGEESEEEFIAEIDEKKLIKELKNARKLKNPDEDYGVDKNKEYKPSKNDAYSYEMAINKVDNEDDIKFVIEDDGEEEVVDIDINYDDGEEVEILPPLANSNEAVNVEKNKENSKSKSRFGKMM